METETTTQSESELLQFVHFDGQYDHEEQEEDALSFCDLPLHSGGDDNSDDDAVSFNSSSPNSNVVDKKDDPDRAFQFSTDSSCEDVAFTDQTLLLFGKSVPCHHKPKTTSFSSRVPDDVIRSSVDRFSWRSESLNKARTSQYVNVRTTPGPRRSSSLRLPETGNCRYHQYSSSSSGSFRKHRVLIGLTKFPARMELTEIRRRQSRRRAPEKPVVAGRGGRGHWNTLIGPLRFRSNLLSRLARVSFSCIRHV